MKWLAIALACVAVLLGGARLYSSWVNPRVVRALRASVFTRLRPSAPRFAGTLIVIDLD